jgi:hypothetical protein
MYNVSVIDQQKLQKGRAWAYLAGAAIFAVVVVVRLVVR